MTRYRLIVNPAAGGGSAERSVPPIERMLRESGVEFDVVRTERPLHAIELAQQAAESGVDVVVAVGGDGTANEALNGLIRAKSAGSGTAALGVLCVGRGNDFAFGAGIPQNLEAGCRALAANRRRTIDVGRASGDGFPEGRYFGNGVGIGFDTVVGLVAAKLKRLRGFAGYLVAALKTIFLYFKAPLVRVETDNGSTELRALMVSIMNGRRMGGGFMMAPDGEPDDGIFHLCIAREVSRPKILALILRFMKGTQASHPAIATELSTRVTVTAIDGTLPAHADGEILCEEGSEVTIGILPAAIEIIVPLARESR
ncbi:diacylglycerol/lipid kinase family protein [Candidatus Bipolaricaulota bacterium]